MGCLWGRGIVGVLEGGFGDGDVGFLWECEEWKSLLGGGGVILVGFSAWRGVLMWGVGEILIMCSGSGY